MTVAERKLPVHAPMDQFRMESGELVVGGERLSLLAARVGQTPFYAYDRSLLRQRVAALRAALPTAVKLHYAMKANPMPAVVGFMAGLVDGIDVASAGELKVALDCGANPLEVSFAGPGKRDAELRQAVASRVLINVESFREIGALEAISQELGVPARVAVRVNPDFELKGSGMKMGGGPKQFGVDTEQMPELLAKIGRAGLAFEGFHLFAGSQNLRPESICEAQQKSFDLAVQLAQHAPLPVKFLNLGGGFGIPYFPGEQRFDLKPIGDNLGELLNRAKTELPQAEFVIELGRYLVGEAGVYVTRVVDRKVSRGQAALGAHHERKIWSERPKVANPAFSYSNRRIDAYGAAARSKRSPHDDPGPRGRAWRNAEPAYEFARRGPWFADRKRGPHRSAHPAGHRPRIRRRRHGRPACGQLRHRGVDHAA